MNTFLMGAVKALGYVDSVGVCLFVHGVCFMFFVGYKHAYLLFLIRLMALVRHTLPIEDKVYLFKVK